MTTTSRKKLPELDWNKFERFITQFGIKISPSASLLHEIIREFVVPSPSEDFERALWRGESLLRDTLIDLICRDVRITGGQRVELLEQLMNDHVLGQLVMKFNLLSIFPSSTFSPAKLEMNHLSRLLKATCGVLTLDVGREKAASFIELVFLDELERIKNEL